MIFCLPVSLSPYLPINLFLRACALKRFGAQARLPISLSPNFFVAFPNAMPSALCPMLLLLERQLRNNIRQILTPDADIGDLVEIGT